MNNTDILRANLFMNEMHWIGHIIHNKPNWNDKRSQSVQNFIFLELTEHAHKFDALLEWELIYNETVWHPNNPQEYGNVVFVKCRPHKSLKWYFADINLAIPYQPLDYTGLESWNK